MYSTLLLIRNENMMAMRVLEEPASILNGNLNCVTIGKNRPRRDSNPQSSDSKSDALSIRPRGHVSCCVYLYTVGGMQGWKIYYL